MYRTEASVASRANANTNAARLPAPRPVRYRSRDFGSGYGNSSGYAAARRYVPGNQPTSRFRLA